MENIYQFFRKFYKTHNGILRELIVHTCKGSVFIVMQLEQYQRLIYLKPGMEVIGNTDELFELPEEGHFYAVPNSFYGDKIGYCPISNPAKLGSESPLSFNTEMFVFQPSLDTFNALNHKLLAKV